MTDAKQRSLVPSVPQFWLGVVIIWALIGSILGLLPKGPPSPANFVALGLSLVATIGYLYYVHRAGFQLGGKFTGKQLIYYAVLIAIGVTLLVILL